VEGKNSLSGKPDSLETKKEPRKPQPPSRTAPRPTPKPLLRDQNRLSGKPDSLGTKKETKETQQKLRILKCPRKIQPERKCMIQIGSYREEATAQSSVKRLFDKGYQAQLRMKDIPQKGENGFGSDRLLRSRSEAERNND